jgi:hypothetical protein
LEILRWQLEGRSKKCASKSKVWRDAGDTTYRKNHKEEAKL